ncbi:MAG TPA: hypothetical protein VGF94_17150 [Kofleriaceae bacterium]|jgi:phosphohistidine swiveling domain-containing protein
MQRSFACLVLLAACNSSNGGTPDALATGDAPPNSATAVVVAGDFTAGHPGTMGVVDPKTLHVMTNAAPQGAVGDDPVIRYFDGQIYIVNRADGDNVTILDGATRALVEQDSTGAGSNPQDVAVVGGELYVPVFGGNGLAVVTAGSGDLHTIDLSMDDPDGKPNCNSIFAAGGLLYVSCELLDDTMQFLPPRGPGMVYVVDPATELVVASVPMMNVNPFGAFVQLPSGDLAIPTVDFATDDGCVEMISTGATPASDGCLVDNADVDGYVAGMAVQALSTGQLLLWLSVSEPDFIHANLIAFDLGAGTLADAPSSPDTEVIESVATCPDGSVIVTDGAMATGGVRVYRDGAEVTTTALSIGLLTQNSDAIVCY